MITKRFFAKHHKVVCATNIMLQAARSGFWMKKTPNILLISSCNVPLLPGKYIKDFGKNNRCTSIHPFFGAAANAQDGYLRMAESR